MILDHISNENTNVSLFVSACEIQKFWRLHKFVSKWLTLEVREYYLIHGNVDEFEPFTTLSSEAEEIFEEFQFLMEKLISVAGFSYEETQPRILEEFISLDSVAGKVVH